MRLVQLARGEQGERVGELVVTDLPAGGLVEFRAVVVDLVPRGPVLVERLGEERLAVLERGDLRDVQRRDGDGRAVRYARDLRREPADAQAFEEGGDAVHRAARAG